MAAVGPQGGPEDQTAYEGDPREFHARHRRRAHHRVLRLGRVVCVRPQGQAALEEGPRRPRCRLLHGPGGAMGDRELADPARGRRDRPRGRAEGLVPRGAGCEDREGTLAHRPDRRADVGHADRPSRERPDADHRQRLPARGRVRLQDREGNLEARPERRHPRADAGGERRPDLHHQRARPDVARLRDQGDRDRRHHTAAGCHELRITSPGAFRRAAATCARRSSIAASPTSSPTTGC